MNIVYKNKKNTDQQELTLNDIEKLKNSPIIETKYNKSKDGKYVIVKTIITDIKPISYWEKVFQED